MNQFVSSSLITGWEYPLLKCLRQEVFQISEFFKFLEYLHWLTLTSCASLIQNAPTFKTGWNIIRDAKLFCSMFSEPELTEDILDGYLRHLYSFVEWEWKPENLLHFITFCATGSFNHKPASFTRKKKNFGGTGVWTQASLLLCHLSHVPNLLPPQIF
jgi:hypothetical protein